jgi:hypothetical protein
LSGNSSIGLLGHDGGEGRCANLHQRTLTAHGDRFRRRTDFEGECQGSLLGNGQHDAALNAGREALERRARLVPSGCKPRHREVPLCVADGTPGQAGFEIGDNDVDAWQDAAGFVFNRS